MASQGWYRVPTISFLTLEGYCSTLVLILQYYQYDLPKRIKKNKKKNRKYLSGRLIAFIRFYLTQFHETNYPEKM